MPVPVVAVAASAGGVEALKRLVGALPADLPACVLVALHLPVDGQSLLRGILGRRTPLEVLNAENGLRLRPGTVVVARPDRHLLVVEGAVALGRGPSENGHRPSHDAMLRSVALAAERAAVGVVLTGLLDDGAAGLAVVQRYGGACLVQDPADAEFPSMPESALRAVPSVRVAPLGALAEEVVRAVQDQQPTPVPEVPAAVRSMDERELLSALGGSPSGPDDEPLGEPSPYGCPECHGVLNEVPDVTTLRYRCRTGHAWTAPSLLSRQDAEVENALWTALRILEERSQVSHALAAQAEKEGRSWAVEHYEQRAGEAERSAASLRGLLLDQVSLEGGSGGDA